MRFLLSAGVNFLIADALRGILIPGPPDFAGNVDELELPDPRANACKSKECFVGIDFFQVGTVEFLATPVFAAIPNCLPLVAADTTLILGSLAFAVFTPPRIKPVVSGNPVEAFTSALGAAGSGKETPTAVACVSAGTVIFGAGLDVPASALGGISSMFRAATIAAPLLFGTACGAGIKAGGGKGGAGNAARGNVLGRSIGKGKYTKNGS